MIGIFNDDGHTWVWVRLWPSQVHLVWCIERWTAGQVERHLKMLTNSAARYEEPIDLADRLADEAGIYEDPQCGSDVGRLGDHADGCNCRVYWVPWITRRMRDAVHAEDKRHD